jgi:exopolysaccharide production protein ExoQ
LKKLIGFIEQCLLMFVWLFQAMSLFFPWELYVNPQSDVPGAPMVVAADSSISRVIVLLSYVIVAGLTLLRFKAVLRALRVGWPIVLLCAWILLSVTWGPEPGKSGVLRYLIMALFAAYVASRFSTEELVAFLTRGFALTLVMSIGAVVLAPKLGFGTAAGEYASSWRGAFTQKNWLGAAMSLGVLVGGYSYIIRANKRWLSLLTLLGCLVLLAMSRSATAAASMLLSLLVLTFGAAVQTRGPVLRTLAFCALAGGILVLLILPLGLVDISTSELSKVAGRSATLTGRTDLWRAVWAAIQQRPLIGHGYGFWGHETVARANIWAQANWQVPHSHDDWLDAWLQVGLVGVMLSAFVWLSGIARAAWLVLARYGHGALFYLVLMINCVSRSFTETVTFAPVLVSVFWLVAVYIRIAQLARRRNAEVRVRENELKEQLRRARLAPLPVRESPA